MSSWIYFDPPPTAAFVNSRRDKAKDAIGKIAQLVPGPILGAYGAALGTLPLFTPEQQPWVGVVLFALGILGTAWIVGWQIGGSLKKGRHQIVYVAAFAVWAYSLTGRITLPWIYHPGIGALLPIISGFVFYQIPLPKTEARRR